jgi:hypothetical protein
MQSTKDLVMRYFNSWQNQDWKMMRHCLADRFSLDSGSMQFQSADQFTEFCMKGERWSKVQLLDSLFQDSKASILYEGQTETGQKMRVAEFLHIEKDKISAAQVVITFL